MKGLNFKKILCSMLLVALICQMGVSSVVAETNDIKPVEHEVVEETVDEEVPVEISTTENFYYISDLDYVSENRWSYSSWGEIKKDTNIDGDTISLLIDGTRMYFKKGMAAHATSQLTYDVSSYSNVYTRFVAKMGVDAARNGNGEVWFRISVSNDGKDWTELYKSEAVTSKSNMLFVDVDISNYKYLRLYADSNGSNAADHSVYADARLVKTNYDLSSELVSFIKPLSYYDEILSKNTVEENYNNHLNTVLQREFVNRMGYWSLQNVIRDDESGSIREAVEWVFKDNGIITNIDENTSIANNSSYNTGQFSSNSLWVSADEVSSAVKDNKDKSAEDKNNASIKDNVSGSNELTNDTSSSNERVETNNYWLLWVIIAFIVILVLLFIFIRFKRDNSKE